MTSRFALLALLTLLATPFLAWTAPARAAGEALYPDLVALPPTDLYFSREVLAGDRTHLLLRFTAISWNAGEGPLELVGEPEAGGITVWQQIYDAPAAGQVVARRRLAADFIDHPRHRHFHLADYFGFSLERRGPLGLSWSLPIGAGKLSSCVFDDVQIDESAQRPGDYSGCMPERQGMSPGWGDIYDASLPDQWVDLGSEPLRDGTYVLRVTVDPLQRIDEAGRETNNAATTTFVVRDGRIAGMPESARCRLGGEASGPVGATVELVCSHFTAGAPVAVYWDGRDPWAVPPHRPVARFAGDTPPVTVRFPVPDAPVGGHNVAAVVVGSEEEGATVIYGVEPSMTVVPASLERGLIVTLRGFGPEEPVAVSWQDASGGPAAMVTTSQRGSATVLIPASLGEESRRLRAIGEVSGAEVEVEAPELTPGRGWN